MLNSNSPSAKTGDIITHDDQEYVVFSIEMHQDRVLLGLRPVLSAYKSIYYDELNQPVRDSKFPQRLVAGENSRLSMQKGYQLALVDGRSSNRVVREPYTVPEIVDRIKTLIVERLSVTGEELVSQKTLDVIVEKLSAAQGYILGSIRKGALKTSMSPDHATWQVIAESAIQIAGTYNKIAIRENGKGSNYEQGEV